MNTVSGMTHLGGCVRFHIFILKNLEMKKADSFNVL